MSRMGTIVTCAILWAIAAPHTLWAQSLVLDNAVFPAFSPNGSEFVCSSSVGVIRVSIDGTVLDTIAENTPSIAVGSPQWHTSGQKVVFLRRDDQALPLTMNIV